MRKPLFFLVFLTISVSGAGAASPATIPLRSLLVPGWGQWALGQETRAAFFLGTELVLWTGWGLFTRSGQGFTESYRVYAYRWAGADPTRADEAYWRAVELHRSDEDFLEDLRREARRFYPNDLEEQRRYVEEHRVEGDWSWPDQEHWFAFQDLRRSARQAFDRARVTVGVVLVNHLISALDALLTVRTRGKLSLLGAVAPDAVHFALVRRF